MTKCNRLYGNITEHLTKQKKEQEERSEIVISMNVKRPMRMLLWIALTLIERELRTRDSIILITNRNKIITITTIMKSNVSSICSVVLTRIYVQWFSRYHFGIACSYVFLNCGVYHRGCWHPWESTTHYSIRCCICVCVLVCAVMYAPFVRTFFLCNLFCVEKDFYTELSTVMVCSANERYIRWWYKYIKMYTNKYKRNERWRTKWYPHSYSFTHPHIFDTHDG